MQTIETSIDIDAEAEAVWAVLTDGEAYPDWNPFITRLEGELEPERRLTIRSVPPGKRAMTFRPRVKVVEPNRRLVWKGSLFVPNLFDGRHEFAIEERADGVRFVHRETFGGVLVPLVLDEDAIRRGFEEMNEALKERVERGTEPETGDGAA
jgi:hypothetical protein